MDSLKLYNHVSSYSVVDTTKNTISKIKRPAAPMSGLKEISMAPIDASIEPSSMERQ